MPSLAITPCRCFVIVLAIGCWQSDAMSAEVIANLKPTSETPKTEFVRDVVPVLTKLGCNAGACHGSLQGRGGFRLSLLGFDPAADYEQIFKASRGRRVSLASPAQSLLLLKGTAAVPHGGGRRVTPDTTAYEIIRAYIAQGANPTAADEPQIVGLRVTPPDAVLKAGEQVTLQVNALYSNGSQREVTPWALFDARDPQANEVSPQGVITSLRAGKSPISVRFAGHVASVPISSPLGGAQPSTGFVVRNYIDELVHAEWQRLGVTPAPMADDYTFFRRVHFDLIGTLPQVEEVRAFVASTDPTKRQKLIDDLIQRPEYADYWSLRWGDLLRVHRRYVGDKGLGSFSSWLKRSIRENKPLDKLAHELLTAEGNLYANGPVAYYFVDQKPEELAETTAQLFLGVRLQCARCHHHPMEVWGQDDYYGLAAFFTRLEVRDTGERGRFGGIQSLRTADHETRSLQRPAQPRLFGSAEAVPSQGDPRKALADWMVSTSNPYFARNFANRYWAYLIGRGLVEPIDDVRATNPPSNPALLDALGRDLTEHHYDLSHLVRTICNSSVYQLQAELAPDRDRDGQLFTHRVPKRLPAEALLDAINQATGYQENFTGTPPGTRAIALPDPTIESIFLATFGRPLRNNPCECARESAPDLLQALHLVNNTGLQSRIASPGGRLHSLLKQNPTERELAEMLYLSTVSRPPTEVELAIVHELLPESSTPAEGWEDVLWTLLNSPEFSFNH
jgi:hypothetical protein